MLYQHDFGQPSAIMTVTLFRHSWMSTMYAACSGWAKMKRRNHPLTSRRT